MAATTLANLVGMSVSGTPGTGNITLNTNLTGFITAANAGITNGLTVVYEAVDGNNREIGTATYSSTGLALNSRSVTNSTNGNALVSLTSAANIYLSARASDIVNKTGDTIPAGFNVTAYSIGTQSSGTLTPDPLNGNYQYVTNGGAFTLDAPASDCGISLAVTNNASAGSITFSGFTVGSNTGDALDTTNGHQFRIRIERINAVSTYMIQALQ